MSEGLPRYPSFLSPSPLTLLSKLMNNLTISGGLGGQGRAGGNEGGAGGTGGGPQVNIPNQTLFQGNSFFQDLFGDALNYPKRVSKLIFYPGKPINEDSLYKMPEAAATSYGDNWADTLAENRNT
ncbi:hypothetical protein MSAN_02506600 [Mycena sanguinolenta]|uniref:Uncharacterized protein n=1 Tax=Mycena sanguinolenta TaxID=230812 RepID=A0A8H6U1F6_9AGAR|nr:hypothetical protein MSAN_02506600 [Mycena sanguinolenta]